MTRCLLVCPGVKPIPTDDLRLARAFVTADYYGSRFDIVDTETGCRMLVEPEGLK